MASDYDSQVTAANEWHLGEQHRTVMPHALSVEPARLYGLCGFIGSGKNTAATFLLAHTGGQNHSFAGPLKDGVAAIFGWPRAMLEGNSDVSRAWRDQNDVYWSGMFGRPVTPRMVLQEVGTEVFRQYLPNVWLAAAAQRLQPNTTAVFTDARFGNELSWITENNGVLIWIYRSEMPHLAAATTAVIHGLIENHVSLNDAHVIERLRHQCQVDPVHRSETSFLYDGSARPDIVVKNTSTTSDLSLMVRHIHDLHTTTGMTDFPWRTHTLYLSMIESQYWWEWTDTRGDIGVRVYTQENVCVAAWGTS